MDAPLVYKTYAAGPYASRGASSRRCSRWSRRFPGGVMELTSTARHVDCQRSRAPTTRPNCWTSSARRRSQPWQLLGDHRLWQGQWRGLRGGLKRVRVRP
eukprot:11106276-Heterocapsa_arctica.AAC.1